MSGVRSAVIRLVNVVLAAAPIEAAGGASGLFSTARQFGGAVGVAIVGTVFFSRLDGHSFTDAFLRQLIGPAPGLRIRYC